VETPDDPAQLRLLPTGAGEAQPLTNDGINHNVVRCFQTTDVSSSLETSLAKACRLYVQEFSDNGTKTRLPRTLGFPQLEPCESGRFADAVRAEFSGNTSTAVCHGST